MTALTNTSDWQEISSLLSQLSEDKQKELLSFIRNFLDNNKEKQQNKIQEDKQEDDNLLRLVEEQPIVISPQGFRDFIKACLSDDDWEISEEDLAFARKERRIKAAQ